MPDHSILQRTLGMVGKTVTFQHLNKEISDILPKEPLNKHRVRANS